MTALENENGIDLKIPDDGTVEFAVNMSLFGKTPYAKITGS